MAGISAGVMLEVAGWVGGGIAYGAGLVVYVKTQLNTHGEQIAKHGSMINDLQRQHATGVRPQDLYDIKKRLEEQREHTDRKLDLILEVIRAQRQ
jgi:hypothetical protein